MVETQTTDTLVQVSVSVTNLNYTTMTNAIFKLQKVDKMMLPSTNLNHFTYISICDETNRVMLEADHNDSLYKNVMNDLGNDAKWRISNNGDYVWASINYSCGENDISFTLQVSFRYGK